MFWLGLFIGYILGMITCFIVELLCIFADNDNLDKWMEGKDESN